MPASSKHRWIVVGRLNFSGRRQREGGTPPDFTLVALEDAFNSRDPAERVKVHSKGERATWATDIGGPGGSGNDFLSFLLHVGDKSIPDAAYVDMKSLQSKVFKKSEQEGGLNSSHIVIQRTPISEGVYMILIERVPGVSISSTRQYINFLLDMSSLEEEGTDPKGKARKYRPICEISGYQSTTLRQAIRDGEIEDLEFFSLKHETKLDEDSLVSEVETQVRWSVGKRVEETAASRLIEKAKRRFKKILKKDPEAKLFVRLRTGAGQLRRTQIDLARSEALEQVFIHNEYISDFADPLPSTYEKKHDEILSKMERCATKVSTR